MHTYDFLPLVNCAQSYCHVDLSFPVEYLCEGLFFLLLRSNFIIYFLLFFLFLSISLRSSHLRHATKKHPGSRYPASLTTS